MTSSPDSFDQVVAMLDSSVCVVTTVGDGERAGCLVGFACQASITPKRFLAAISVHNHTYRVLASAQWLVVHALQSDQGDLAELFGGWTGDVVDKFAGCAWHSGPHGLPVLDAAPGWFVGRIHERIPFGDHVGFLVEPELGATSERATLGPLRLKAALDIPAGHEG
jgi:flavin reductase (DIM6/NTAB) family NADH-FMN oxidoreductase RutF